MVAVDTSNHLAGVGLEIHCFIPLVDIVSLSTADGDMIFNGTTCELPPAILASVIMIALHSCNILVCWAHEVHWKVPLIDVVRRLRASFCGATTDNISAFPIPWSVFVIIAVHTRDLVHSLCSMAGYREWSVKIILVLHPCRLVTPCLVLGSSHSKRYAQ